MADHTTETFEQEQLLPLSSLANDNWNDGTVGFTRKTPLDNLRCSRMLLSSSSPYGIKDCPIVFHVVGRLRREDCIVTCQSAPNLAEESTSIKLCIEELPESISHIEWKQCATALDSLGMMAILSSHQYVETKYLFQEPSDEDGRGFCLFVHGEGLKDRLGDELSEFDELIPTANSEATVQTTDLDKAAGMPVLSDLVNSVNHFRFPRITLSAMSNSIAQMGKAVAERVLLSGLKYSTRVHAGSQMPQAIDSRVPIYDCNDRRMLITSTSQLPEDVPIRATFVLELAASELEYTADMRAKLVKLSVLARA